MSKQLLEDGFDDFLEGVELSPQEGEDPARADVREALRLAYYTGCRQVIETLRAATKVAARRAAEFRDDGAVVPVIVQVARLMDQQIEDNMAKVDEYVASRACGGAGFTLGKKKEVH